MDFGAEASTTWLAMMNHAIDEIMINPGMVGSGTSKSLTEAGRKYTGEYNISND